MQQPDKLQLLSISPLPPGFRTLLKKLMAAGWSWTHWRQQKEVTREKEERWEEVKESPWVTSSWWKEVLGAWQCCLQ